jgi:hypothetical protein
VASLRRVVAWIDIGVSSRIGAEEGEYSACSLVQVVRERRRGLR